MDCEIVSLRYKGGGSIRPRGGGRKGLRGEGGVGVFFLTILEVSHCEKEYLPTMILDFLELIKVISWSQSQE